MRFLAHLSDHESTLLAADAILDAAAALPSPDLALLFFTDHHTDQARELLERIHAALDPATLVGCSAEGVIGPTRELERAPAMVLMTASLPQVRLSSFSIGRVEWQELLSDTEQLKARLGAGPETRAILGFGDPFTTPAVNLMSALDELLPGIPLIGGMASAAQQPGQNVLLCDQSVHSEGMVGLSLSGPIEVDTVVSQGCRPFGTHMVITKSRDNVIQQLGGKPALQVLRDAIMELPESERQLLQNGLFVGRAISEYRDTFGRGDFLVRSVVGVDNASGAIAIGDYVRTGQTIQFHVRDAATATEDLSLMLAGQSAKPPAAGALLFSCNGRGTRLFETASHDVHAANAAMPQTPVAGFFAAGELGPIGARNFIHGHTASFALFRQRE